MCGPTGQKLLQFIVMHDGFLSDESKEELSYIFEECTTHSWEDTEKIYLHEFGKYIDEDFCINYKDTVPIGSGTIGQVYRLYSKHYNDYVALKVRHINVYDDAHNFVKIFTRVINIMNAFAFMPFTILINEFLENICIQLDYTNEAYNTDVLRKNNLNNKHIIIPTVYYSSESVICMSYHDGVPFTSITDNVLKSRISHDLLMFNMSSILIHDLLHCDLHYGNWKVDIKGDDYNIIIYDCGIMGSTFNPDINKDICMACMDGDYNKIYSILVNGMGKQKNDQLMKEFTSQIMRKGYKNRDDRFSQFLKQMFIYNIRFNRRYLRCIQGLMTCLSLIIISSEKLSKLLGKEGCRLEIFICYYSGVLEKTKRYPELLQHINQWIEEDKNIESVFYKWLDAYFGHDDKSAFIDAILIKFKED
jgi:predicted unusual protein kinase regulating ubiquinone biosynthesis (AarF/ABC1/UbiB family)